MSFDKYSNYNKNTSFSSVVFGSDKPLLEVELNEMQQIIQSKITRLLKGFRSGVIPLSDDSISLDKSSLVLTVRNSIILENSVGLTAYVPSASVTLSSSNKNAYFAIQEINVDGTSTLKEEGNTAGAVVNNPIIDSRVGVETTRRKAVSYTLMCGSSVPANTDNIKYVLVGTYNYSSDLFTPVKWGLEHPEFFGSISMGRKGDSVIGGSSVALGLDNTASNRRSFAFGQNNNVSGSDSFTAGKNNTVSSGNSVAFNEENTAKGSRSTAFGYKTSSESDSSFSEGSYTKAKGINSHSMGNSTIALQNQLSIGAFNDETVATQNSTSGSSNGTAFVIGNGVTGAKSNAFRVQGDGVVYAKGAYNATGADYAEYSEWADGNPENEDRRGYFVTFDEEKPNMIRKANSNDIDILGVVSGNPCIIGNSDECWLGKNVFDEFGSPIYETVEEIVEVLDEETGGYILETAKITRHKINPNYDHTQRYIHRKDRKEWSAVGWIGVLSVRDDGTCKVGGYCTWNDEGIATSALPSRFNYRVIERVNDNVVKVVIK